MLMKRVVKANRTMFETIVSMLRYFTNLFNVVIVIISYYVNYYMYLKIAVYLKVIYFRNVKIEAIVQKYLITCSTETKLF